MKFKKKQNYKGRNKIRGCQKMGIGRKTAYQEVQWNFLIEIVFISWLWWWFTFYQNLLNCTPEKGDHYCI